MEDLKLPMLSFDLIKMLNEVFPEKCASLTDTDREVWFKAGARSVVVFLQNKLKETDDALSIF